MGKLARTMTAAQRGPTGPVVTTSERTTTAEGGAGFARDVKGELFLLAVTQMVGEDTFYEKAKDRDSRFVQLIHQTVAEDAGWVARFIPWLRTGANMRTASVVAAAEYARAVTALFPEARAKTPTVRSVVDSALQRPDEPGEFAAYFLADRTSKMLPGGVGRGLADAVIRLYTERAALKYDGINQPWRLGDVIELAHPTPKAEWQSDLFKYLLDKRHHNDAEPTDNLRMLRFRAELDKIPQGDRAGWLRDNENAGAVLAEAGMTWEALSGWLGGPMDQIAWESVIPSMGLFALTRNLRNFDQAGVSDELAATIAAKLNDPEQVKRSRMFPLRFLSAFKAAPSLRWSWPLEQAVQHSVGNVPTLSGRTLVLVDQSGSMASPLSNRSTVLRSEAAALFGFALGQRAEYADVYCYGASAGAYTGLFGGWQGMRTHHVKIDLPKGGSLLPLVNQHGQANLGGTMTWTTLAETFRAGFHDRVVILTDEQAHDHPAHLPNVPIITFNLAGHKAAHVESGPNRITIGGLSDAGFQMLGLLDQRHRGQWPF